MNSKASFRAEGACLYLGGDVNFSTVTALLPQGEQWLRTDAPLECCVDLQDVSRCNSAGMALLLAWLRVARKANKQMVIRNVPDVLAAIISLAGLEQELGVATRQ